MAGKNGSEGSVIEAKPFKYRSIDDIAKRQILEMQREDIERQHYALSFRMRILEQLPEEGDSEFEQRKQNITQLRDQLALLETMLDNYNDELLTLNEAIEAAKE